MLAQSSLNNRGGSLVEIVVIAGIIVGSLAVILGLAAFFLATSQVVQQTSQATALAQEALEIVRNIRDGTEWSVDGLGTFTLGDLYHPEQLGGPPPEWTLVAGSETIDEFARQIVFEEVYRDGSDNIYPSGGSLDPDTVKTVAVVSWEERGRTHRVELVAYFTNWR
ncbi:MAG: hypothetical protein A3J30_01175 [Candidatus Wildermuthbacteria bacterium RIFCSPLOWO2_02_FULL_47_9c]|uniref:Uncharacterized protein n=2 Tax=Parcubacteria group TaxID=1794811 RepID=A0A837IM09_9BACT|nr:MAG: hypothetical protein UY25_C0001G0129 [Candidatus Yanofskybacteria bacterium GW2011_GWC1_48_11]KKW03896.1 MAG: hypothetical protein UY38_C0002G0050 [Parcubacteria group bacterium GW2011_GWB1_49_12]KKW08542.1 MAG: hypothetical protein UY45_C0006G0028 [Parcubacteria group bacterium GW2011_GWA1_49_26]KKW14019.1 MAG: hypothetical protein UY53_C0004G0070 [Parcubacteria group bacterium GW2011_GWA2_50_10]OHA61263.1 MAG: hypothetical protein A2109_03245 [Candidatus Wildermuthbacteria bacterium G